MGSFAFQLGPLAVGVAGNDWVADWIQSAFATARTDHRPQLLFNFVNRPVHPSAGSMGDGRFAVARDALSFQTGQFEVRIRRELSLECVVDLYRRDRRALLVRSVCDPEETWKLWLSHGASLDIHPLKEWCYKIAPMAIQFALWPHGAAMIHASAFSIDDQGVLLPAWRAVGKSAVANRVVLHGTARFLADDFAVVDSTGHAHLCLLPVHVNAHHMAEDPVLKRQALSSFSPLNRAQWVVGSRLKRSKAVRWIRPADLFAHNRIAQHAPIHQVIVMFRGETDEFQWRDCSPADAARSCVGSTFRELAGLSGCMVGAQAGCHPSILPSLGQGHELLSRIYLKAFDRAACALFCIPRRASITQLIDELRRRSPLIHHAMPPTDNGH